VTVTDADRLKHAAAARAIEFVRPGMRLGLGTGSTAKHFVALLGERVRAGLDVVAVPTSEATQADAERAGVRLTTLDETPELDLTVDGADEIAPDLTLIKGGGGALLREKIVAAASGRMIVIADESKFVATLGRFPLPIEVVPFGLAARDRRCRARRARAMFSSRMGGTPSLMPRSRAFQIRNRWAAGSPRSRAWSSTGCSSAWQTSPSLRDPTVSGSSNDPRRQSHRISQGDTT
jgi:ribose 5-phosphate isomerase